MIEQQATPNRLYRSRKERMIAGVAGGLGQYLNVDPVLLRLGFVLLTLTTGTGLLLYIIMAIVVPERAIGDAEPTAGSSIDVRRSRELLGYVLIGAGLLFLASMYHVFDWGRAWPVFFIGIGLFLLLRRRDS